MTDEAWSVVIEAVQDLDPDRLAKLAEEAQRLMAEQD